MFTFVTFTLLDGRTVHVNPKHVVSVGETKDGAAGTFTPEAHCVVNLLDGKFITLAEDCDNVRRRLEDARK